MKDQEKEAMKSPNELSKINWKHIKIYVFTKFIWGSLDFVQNQGELLGCQHPYIVVHYILFRSDWVY